MKVSKKVLSLMLCTGKIIKEGIKFFNQPSSDERLLVQINGFFLFNSGIIKLIPLLSASEASQYHPLSDCT